MSGPAGDRMVANRYALSAPLGRGGMGVVWRARDAVLGREVAVKEVVFPPTMPDEERRPAQARVMREARAAARLNHPGAVTLYDVVKDDGGTFIVMELVNAPTLADLVRSDGPLPVERVAEIGAQVASALEAAHQAGIVHRDVKPGNVMVPGNGTAKLADFGIASLQGDPQLTSTGLVIGSPAYMAPEQAKGEESGPPADFWALGATMFYAVEGEPPFDRGTSIATLAAVVNDPPPAPRRAGRLTPLITALLNKDPGSRPSGPELRAELGRLAAVPASPSTEVLPSYGPGRTVPLPAGPPPPAPAASPDRPRRWSAAHAVHPALVLGEVRPVPPAAAERRVRRGCGQPGAPLATFGYAPPPGGLGPAGRALACRPTGRRRRTGGHRLARRPPRTATPVLPPTASGRRPPTRCTPPTRPTAPGPTPAARHPHSRPTVCAPDPGPRPPCPPRRLPSTVWAGAGAAVAAAGAGGRAGGRGRVVAVVALLAVVALVAVLFAVNLRPGGTGTRPRPRRRPPRGVPGRHRASGDDRGGRPRPRAARRRPPRRPPPRAGRGCPRAGRRSPTGAGATASGSRRGSGPGRGRASTPPLSRSEGDPERVFTVRSANPANPLPQASRDYRRGGPRLFPEGYREVSYEEGQTYAGREGAVVFEYEAVRDGRRVHVSHINLKGRTWGYNVELIAPAAEWDASKGLARQFEQAFRRSSGPTAPGSWPPDPAAGSVPVDGNQRHRAARRQPLRAPPTSSATAAWAWSGGPPTPCWARQVALKEVDLPRGGDAGGRESLRARETASLTAVRCMITPALFCSQRYPPPPPSATPMRRSL